MIKKRFCSSSSSASSLIVGLLQNHQRCCCCCSMAAANSSSTLVRNSYRDAFELDNCNGFQSFGLKFKPFSRTVCVKSCGDKINENGNNKGVFKGRRPRAFSPSPSLSQLIGGDSGKKSNGSVDQVFDKSRGCHTLGFPDPLPHKFVVAVDVDEVLGNFVSALNRFIADRYSSNHSVSEYHVYEFFKIWNCSRKEADIRVHEFFKTSYFKKGIHPLPGSQQALQKLSRFCNLSVVTSRQNVIKDHTVEWIETHFPGLFHEIHFGNHFALDGQSRPKSDICRSLGAKVLIDDNPRYAAECAAAGIKVLLFDYDNTYPWCKVESVAQHPLVVKVHNWEEVERQLVSQVAS